MNCPLKQYLVVCPFSRYISYNEKTYSRVSGNSLTVKTENIINSNNRIQESLQIPVFQGNINPKVLQNINKNIKSDILEFKNQMERAADENFKNNLKKGKPTIPFEISNSYLVTYNRNNILSVSIIYQEYINGINSFIKTTYNYDLNTGESMPLRSIFKQGVDYIKILNAKINNKISEINAVDSSFSPYQFKGISEDQPYYLDKNSLAIFLKFNQMAPIVTDIPIVKIPFKELSEILKPNFLRN